ncbi:MAG: FG-GAP-like repeat-containing protein [Saprospiraceae bacterium]
MTFLASFLLGQEPAVFINRSIDLPVQNDSDYSLAVADLNGDYRDDIIRQSTNSWQIILQKQDGSFFGEVKDIPKPFTALTTNITDIDGDYIPEILMSGNKTGISIIKFDMQGLSFNIDDHIESNHYAQGSSVGDINGDGLLDYYVANDN